MKGINTMQEKTIATVRPTFFTVIDSFVLPAALFIVAIIIAIYIPKELELKGISIICICGLATLILVLSLISDIYRIYSTKGSSRSMSRCRRRPPYRARVRCRNSACGENTTGEWRRGMRHSAAAAFFGTHSGINFLIRSQVPDAATPRS